MMAKARSASRKGRFVIPQAFVLVHGAWHGGWSWRHVARFCVPPGMWSSLRRSRVWVALRAERFPESPIVDRRP